MRLKPQQLNLQAFRYSLRLSSAAHNLSDDSWILNHQDLVSALFKEVVDRLPACPIDERAVHEDDGCRFLLLGSRGGRRDSKRGVLWGWRDRVG